MLPCSPAPQRAGLGRLHVLAALLVAACACLLFAEEKTPAPAEGKTATTNVPAAGHPYNYPFGASPFLPSQARTASAGFIAAAEFPSAKYCGNCHQDIHQQ